MELKRFIRNKDVFNLLIEQGLSFKVESLEKYRSYIICIETDKYCREGEVPNITVHLGVPNNNPYALFNEFYLQFEFYCGLNKRELNFSFLLERLKAFYEASIMDEEYLKVSSGRYWECHLTSEDDQWDHILFGHKLDNESVISISLQPKGLKSFDKAQGKECYYQILKFLKFIVAFIENPMDKNNEK